MTGKRAKKNRKQHAATATPPAPLDLYRRSLREALGRGGKTLAAMQRACTRHGAGTLEGDDERILVWSDLHLGHANIIPFQDRPFGNVHEMDAALWAAWYEAVTPDDTIVCVGDFAMGGADEKTWDRVRMAPGRSKILVIGNHDLRGGGSLRVSGFNRTKAVLVSAGEPPLIWTHAPLPEVPAGHVNVHGHMHARRRLDSPHINVSVEQLDYRPVPLTSLRALAREMVEGAYPPGETTIKQIRAVEGG